MRDVYCACLAAISGSFTIGFCGTVLLYYSQEGRPELREALGYGWQFGLNGMIWGIGIALLFLIIDVFGAWKFFGRKIF